jgi:bifunctional non-homologous end joining protein LigD
VFPVRRLGDDGYRAWAEVQRRGLEGFVGKDPASSYRTGGPTRLWLKSKVCHEGEFVVGDVVETADGWSLLVGSPERGQLKYRGAVHFGVGRKLAEVLTADGPVRSTSPFSERVPLKGVTWLEPRLTAQVRYAEIMQGGKHVPVCSGDSSVVG